MTRERALFLKTFDPCADRVEAIEKSLHDGLDEKSSLDLMDHIETCKRCRRFRGYLEAVEQGFRNLPVDLSEISPMASRELPTVLQDEMAQAMKRNLSRWLFETVRCVMHRDKMVHYLFLDENELYPINKTLVKTNTIYLSLSTIKVLSKEDSCVLSEVGRFLNRAKPYENRSHSGEMVPALRSCLGLYNDFTPLHYLFQFYLSENNLEKAKEVSLEAVQSDSSALFKSIFQNNLGAIAYWNKNFEEAIGYYLQALEGLSLPSWHMNAAFLYLELKRIPEAVCHITQSYDKINAIINKKQRRLYRKRFCESVNIQYNDYKNLIESDEKLNNLFENMRGIEL